MILITGGMGFIGLHTARRFVDQGQDVVITQFRARREPDFIKDELGKRVHVETLDVTDSQAVQAVCKKYSVERIVHLAVPGLGSLPPGEETRVNVLGLVNMLEASEAAGVKRLSFASSVACYWSLPRGPFLETTGLPTHSGTPTETFKKVEEVIALHYADRTGLDVVAMRIGGIYGPLYHSMMNLPSRIAHAAARGTEPDFSPQRGGAPFEEDENDFCYVKDCAQGIQLLTMADKLPQRVYNVGAGQGTRNREVLEAARAVTPDVKGQMQPGKGARYKPDAYMDISRIRQDVGYEPKFDIRSAMADYIEWLRAGNQQ